MSPVFGIRLALVLLAVTPGGFEAKAQEANVFEAAKTEAHQLFHEGKVQQSATRLLAIAKEAPSAYHKVALYRDLLEVCATGYYWRCVGQTLNAVQLIIPEIRSQPGGDILVHNLLPEFILYELKMKLWNDDEAYPRQLIEAGAPFNIQLRACC
jgi:hypothetical protein